MKGKKRVCIVAPVHYWDDVRVFQKEARSLANAEWDVSLIAQAPSEMVVAGVRIIPARAPKTPRWRRFMCLPLVLSQALKIRANVYHLHNPDTLPLVLLLKCFGNKVIYDTHEDFAERMKIRSWVPRPFRTALGKLISTMERIASRIANAAIGTQEDVVHRLGNKAVLIGNFPRYTSELLREVNQLAASIRDEFDGLRAIYIGGISKSRGLFDMVEGLALANKHLPVRLWLIGPPNNQDLQEARLLTGWRYVDYYDRMPQVNAFSYVVRADVGLIVLRNVGGHSKSNPNKIYEYMVFGVPFIASDFSAWKKGFEPINAGRFVPSGDPNALAQELVEMAKSPSERIKMGSNGLAYVKTHNWEHEFEKLKKLYEHLCDVPKDRTCI